MTRRASQHNRRPPVHTHSQGQLDFAPVEDPPIGRKLTYEDIEQWKGLADAIKRYPDSWIAVKGIYFDTREETQPTANHIRGVMKRYYGTRVTVRTGYLDATKLWQLFVRADKNPPRKVRRTTRAELEARNSEVQMTHFDEAA